MPKSRLEYWAPKLRRNKERDAEARRALTAIGWSVLIVWECETADTGALAERLSSFLADTSQAT